MQLRKIGNQNCTEVTLANGTMVLFSYSTPVAACLMDGTGYIKTNRTCSKITTKHIKNWLKGHENIREVTQAELEALTS